MVLAITAPPSEDCGSSEDCGQALSQACSYGTPSSSRLQEIKLRVWHTARAALHAFFAST